MPWIFSFRPCIPVLSSIMSYDIMIMPYVHHAYVSTIIMSHSMPTICIFLFFRKWPFRWKCVSIYCSQCRRKMNLYLNALWHVTTNCKFCFWSVQSLSDDAKICNCWSFGHFYLGVFEKENNCHFSIISDLFWKLFCFNCTLWRHCEYTRCIFKLIWVISR